MKRNWTLGAAALLTLSLLTGCAKAQEPVTTTAAAVTQAPEETTSTTVPTTIPVTEPETTSASETEPEQVFQVTITPVITQPQTQVTVSTVDEFLAAIGPNTEILLNAELLDLSEATGFGKDSGEYYYWGEEFDGSELRICQVSNLTIRGTGENHGVNVIAADPRYADVLTFENCSNIHTVGFTAGHSKEPGCCMGGVLSFQNCQDILVEDCGLFGCGTLGVKGESSKNMQIVGNEIYECSVGGVYFSNCDNVNVDGNTFRDLGGSIFRIYDSGTITYNGEDAKPYNFKEF